MNHAVILLHALKDTCALHCLVALCATGPVPVTQQKIMAMTGFDDGAVHKGLHKLLEFGLVTCSGEHKHTGWQLALGAQQLPLALFGPAPASVPPLPAAPPAPASEPPAPTAGWIPAAAESTSGGAPGGQEREGEKDKAPSTEIVTVAVAGKTQDNARERRRAGARLQKPSPPHPPPEREAQLAEAMAAMGVYPQIRARLARELAADPRVDWLAHTLGWIRAIRGDSDAAQPGGALVPCLRDRIRCEARYLPPPELPFAEALAWALRGGAPEPEPEPEDELDDEPAEADPAPAEAAPEPEPLLDPDQRTWQAALDRLQREMPRAAFEQWLRPTRLAAREGPRWRLRAASPQARDWLQNRLAAHTARVLRELTGEAAEAAFVWEPA